MGNLLSIFSANPRNMPGQGLASPDFDPYAQEGQYNSLLRQFSSGLDRYGGEIGSTQLKNLNQMLQGSRDQPGVVQQYLDSLRTADPGNAALLDKLSSDATTELGWDNQLDPNQTRQVEQSVRAGGADRGLGYGPAELYQETMAKTGYGDALRDKRRSNALMLQQLKQAMASKPIDWATQMMLSQSPEQNMWNTLQQTYGQNQENARTKAQLETQIGQQQADIWNGWFKTAAAAI